MLVLSDWVTIRRIYTVYTRIQINIHGLLRKAMDPDRSVGSGTPRTSATGTLLRRIYIFLA
jgi:hypothetical protein